MKRYTVDDVGRIYIDEQGRWYASVSTVLDVRPKPEALKNWLQRTDNSDEINRFKRNRGTLIHYECLNPLFQESIGDSEADMWSPDEQSSLDELKDEGKWSRAKDDIEWAKETWDMIRRIHNMDHIIDVETYVKNPDVGYAGQFDLLYQDTENNETVLADIKTGKSIYTKNQDQLSAYKHAVPIAVDRVEIIRINPDFRDWTIASDRDWDRSIGDAWDAYTETREKFEREKIDDVMDEIERLMERGKVAAESEA